MPEPTPQAHDVEAAFAAPAGPVVVRADIAALTHQGQVREANEDSYLVFRIGRFLERVASNVPETELPSRLEDTGHLMMVADGVGGHEAGEVASRNALIGTLQMVFRSPRWALKLDDPETREREIREMLERARGYIAGVHAALRRQAADDVKLLGMATTLTGAYAIGADLFVMHIGDSKAYVLRDGALVKVTRDHTLAQQYANLGVISQKEVANHHLQHVLTRAMGAPTDDLEGDMHYVRIANGDRLLLCSDGLTDMANEAAIRSILADYPGSADACRALVELALAAGGRDNITVIVAGFTVQ